MSNIFSRIWQRVTVSWSWVVEWPLLAKLLVAVALPGVVGLLVGIKWGMLYGIAAFILLFLFFTGILFIINKRERLLGERLVAVVLPVGIGLPVGIMWGMLYGIAAYILSLLLILITLGYVSSEHFGGIGLGTFVPKETNPNYQRSKTLWDWLGLLIIPFVLSAGAIGFSAQQNQGQAQIAADQQQEARLQTYLDRMSELLLNNKLRESKLGDEVRNIARARTLTALEELDPQRKGHLLIFLYEAQLIGFQDNTSNTHDAIIDLSGANLSNAGLGGSEIQRTNLVGANLSHTNLNAARLFRADFGNANLTRADLRDANLDYADLRYATITQQQLDHVHSCKNTTLPPALRCKVNS